MKPKKIFVKEGDGVVNFDGYFVYEEGAVRKFINEILEEIETGFFMESPAGYKLKAIEEIKQIIKQKAGELLK